MLRRVGNYSTNINWVMKFLLVLVKEVFNLLIKDVICLFDLGCTSFRVELHLMTALLGTEYAKEGW